MNCAENNDATDLWNSLLDASWYRVDSRLVTIGGLGMLLVCSSSLFFQLSGWWSSLRIDTCPDDDLLCFSANSSVVHHAVFLVISWYMCTHVVDTSLHQAIDRSRRHHTLQFTFMSHRS